MIWVVVDRLTKSTYFILVRSTNIVDELSKIYIKEIVHSHVTLEDIVSDKGTQFWRSLQKGLSTKLSLNSVYHPETDGQTEQIN